MAESRFTPEGFVKPVLGGLAINPEAKTIKEITDSAWRVADCNIQWLTVEEISKKYPQKAANGEG